MSKTKPSISQKIAELDALLAWFDGEDFELEAATAKFRQAEELARVIEQELLEMKNEVIVLSERFDQDKG